MVFLSHDIVNQIDAASIMRLGSISKVEGAFL